MGEQVTTAGVFFFLDLVAGAIALFLAISSLRRKAAGAAGSFALLMIGIAVWSWSTGLGMLASSEAVNFIWLTLRMAAVIFVPVGWLNFAARYTYQPRWTTPSVLLMLCIFPTISLLMMATSPWQRLFLVSVDYVRAGPYLIDAVWNVGPWFWVHFAYSYALILLGDVWILRRALSLFSTLRYQAISLLLATIFPLLTNINYVFHLLPDVDVNYDPFGFVLSGAAFFIALYGFRLFDLRPIARNVLVEEMSDAMLVFDTQQHLVDFNPSAAALFKLGHQKDIGADPDSIFSCQPALAAMLAEEDVFELIVQLVCEEGRAQDALTYYEARLTPLRRQDLLLGRMLILRDITEEQHLRESLKQMAVTDPLTGLFNRRQFDIIGQQEMERSDRFQCPFTVMIVDLDHFKQINDTYGHRIGDDVLHHVADLLRRTMRRTDFLFRYGGEEFAVLMPETDAKEARRAAERLRRAVAESVLERDAERITLTISVGACQYSGEKGGEFMTLIDCADRAMYQAKQEGRNRVVVA